MTDDQDTQDEPLTEEEIEQVQGAGADAPFYLGSETQGGAGGVKEDI
ncbi:MAG: hypothetical protein WCP28_02020 [Actinomycetes bacterium]